MLLTKVELALTESGLTSDNSVGNMLMRPVPLALGERERREESENLLCFSKHNLHDIFSERVTKGPIPIGRDNSALTSTEIRIENQKVITLLHPNTIRPTQSVRHIFLTHLRRGVSGATLKFCSPKTAA